MSLPPRQLTLDLAVQPRMGRDDLVVGEANSHAVACLDRWPDWPARVALLSGPIGAGKTHLAHVWAAHAGARTITAAELTDHDPVSLMEPGALVVEDAGPGVDERALFHVINAALAVGHDLLITSRHPLSEWGVQLPDLLSRLRAATPLVLDEPDDGLLEALLAKLFSDRQAVVDPTVVTYLARRMHRSYAVALELVDALDREALVAKSAITRVTAQRVFKAAFSRQPEFEGLDTEPGDENNPS